MDPKVAIVISGHLRSWNLVQESFKEFIGDVNCDLYLTTYTSSKSYHPWIQNHYQIKNNDIKESADEIIASISLEFKSLIIEDENVELFGSDDDLISDGSQNRDLYRIKSRGISRRTFLQFRKFKQGFFLIKDLNSYDFIIKSRFDLDFKGAPNLRECLKFIKLNPGKIWIINRNVFPNDHFYLSTPQSMKTLIDGLSEVRFPTDREYSPHEFLHQATKNKKLEIGDLLPLKSAKVLLQK